ncbi:MAG: glycosyltransferase family 2 protein [Desulfomonile tiedjei]|nr:glycosyltransferase family 2 protein [Desulfomonile tiedjei]
MTRCTASPEAAWRTMFSSRPISSESLSNLGRLSNIDSPVAVIVVNYNSGPYLERCLAALAMQSEVNFCAIIVDNASQDGSASCCQELDERFALLQLEKNIGFAAANNLAAGCVSTDWVATLNPDAIPAGDWLKRLLEATERHPGVAMFGSTQVNESNHSILEGAGDVYSCTGLMWRGQYGHPVSELPEEGFVFSPCAAAALYRADVFRQVGGFDENFFCYCEDVDLGFRMRLLGHECVQVKDSVVFHVGSQSAGKKSAFSTYYGFRNRLWTFVKNVPDVLICFLLLPHVLVTVLLLFREVMSGQARAAWAGLADGITALGPVMKSRRETQNSKKASTLAIAKAMTWSPLKMLHRSSDVRASTCEASRPETR